MEKDQDSESGAIKNKSVTHMWNLLFKNDINELIYKTEVDLEISKTNLWLANSKGGGGKNYELGVNTDSPLHRKQITSEDLLRKGTVLSSL